MRYYLFIDDTRNPNDIYQNAFTSPWLHARSWEDVKKIILDFGYPVKVSFDTDLGENQPSGLDIAKFLCDIDLDDSNNISHLSFPHGFEFSTHSNNLEANKNIMHYLENYMKNRVETQKLKQDMSHYAFKM